MGFDLHRVPASTFGICLGTAGQANLWHFLSHVNETSGPLSGLSSFGAHDNISTGFWVLSLLMLVVTSIIYGAKTATRWRAVKWEFSSSIHVNFFFMPLLTIMVLGVSAPTPPFPHSDFGPVILYIVVCLVLGLELYIYTEWLFGVSRSLAWANPPYQLSIVGNIIGSGAASAVGDPALAMFLFAVGMLYLVLTLAALHTVRDMRAWLGSTASIRSHPSAVSSRILTVDPWLGSTHDADNNSDSLLNSGSPVSSHIQLRYAHNEGGRLVQAASQDDVNAEGLSTGVNVAHPEDNDTVAIIHQPGASAHLTKGTRMQRAIDILSSGEVMTKQLNPLTMNTWSLPVALIPTLFLYVAPPSLAASSWLLLSGKKVATGSCDALCQSFASVGLFFFLIMAANIPRFYKHAPFSIAYWAFTFPSSALAIALVEFGVSTGSTFLQVISLVLVILSSSIWLSVLLATLIVPCIRSIDVLLLPRNVPR